MSPSPSHEVRLGQSWKWTASNVIPPSPPGGQAWLRIVTRQDSLFHGVQETERTSNRGCLIVYELCGIDEAHRKTLLGQVRGMVSHRRLGKCGSAGHLLLHGRALDVWKIICLSLLTRARSLSPDEYPQANAESQSGEYVGVEDAILYTAL